MTLPNDILLRIRAVGSVEARISLEKALYRSLDTSAVERLGPADLSGALGVPLRMLKEYQIVLGKDDALRFLARSGFVIPKSAIRRELTADKYRQQFKRRAAKVGNALVFTYAEVLVLLKIEVSQGLLAYDPPKPPVKRKRRKRRK